MNLQEYLTGFDDDIDNEPALDIYFNPEYFPDGLGKTMPHTALAAAIAYVEDIIAPRYSDWMMDDDECPGAVHIQYMPINRPVGGNYIYARISTTNFPVSD